MLRLTYHVNYFMFIIILYIVRWQKRLFINIRQMNNKTKCILLSLQATYSWLHIQSYQLQALLASLSDERLFTAMHEKTFQ